MLAGRTAGTAAAAASDPLLSPPLPTSSSSSHRPLRSCKHKHNSVIHRNHPLRIPPFFVQSVIQTVTECPISDMFLKVHVSISSKDSIAASTVLFVQCQAGPESVQLLTITRSSTQHMTRVIIGNQTFSRRDAAPDAHQHHLTPQSYHRCPPLPAGLPALGGSGGWGHLNPGLSLGCCCALLVMATSHEPSAYAGLLG